MYLNRKLMWQPLNKKEYISFNALLKSLLMNWMDYIIGRIVLVFLLVYGRIVFRAIIVIISLSYLSRNYSSSNFKRPR